MPNVFVIAQHDQERFVSDAARAVAECGLEATPLLAPPTPRGPRHHEWVVDAFQRIADRMEQSVSGPSALRDSVAVVELSDDLESSLDELNPISAEGWSCVVAMLVLAFPEVHWCFSTSFDPPSTALFVEAHTIPAGQMGEGVSRLLGLHEQNFTPLFDPTGLRSTIRARIRSQREPAAADAGGGRLAPRYVAPYVPVRPRLAVVLDEEEDYAYLNAYIAYRFGFRVHTLTTMRMSEKVLKGGAGRPSPPAAEVGGVGHDNDITLAFEDVYLNYPDKNPERRVSFSSIPQRDEEFTKLLRAKYRIFHTIGHQHRPEDQEIWKENNNYLRKLIKGEDPVHCVRIYKPGSGIFDIWERSGLLEKLKHNGGRADGYVWPPEPTGWGEAPGGHSAPGRLLVISTRLVRRAGRLLHSAHSVPDAIHGAALAMEAQEYLGHRTPTGSLESLALKHQMEVLAECMFYGVEYNMQVGDRLLDIEREVEAISQWFQPRSRESSRLNAELRIVNEIMRTFRTYIQFDEEQETLARIRKLHRKLWFTRHKYWGVLLYVPRLYMETLLNSVPRFVLAILAWIVGLTFVYGFLRDPDPDPPELSWDSLMHGFWDAITTFLGMQPPHDFKNFLTVHKVTIYGQQISPHFAALLTIFAIIASFVHLGIFISHLYSTIARK